jgi:hypothetical protein
MTMGPKYVFGSGRQRLAKRMKMGRQWPIVVFRWACHFRVKCNLIVKIFDRLPISQIAVLASTLTRRILKTPTRLFQCCGEIDMVDFSDPYYGSVDWTVVVALLLFIVSGTALLYRALAPIFLPKVNNKRKRAKLFKKDSPDNLGGFELLQSHFELSSAQIQSVGLPRHGRRQYLRSLCEPQTGAVRSGLAREYNRRNRYQNPSETRDRQRSPWVSRATARWD